MADQSTDHNNNNSYSTEDDEEEEGEIIMQLRRRICSHPLYGLLLETHLNCLKVGGGIGEVLATPDNKITSTSCLNQSDSELDRFMEAYCFALSKLKEAMEESQFKSMEFINAMHDQLSDLTVTVTPPNPK